MKVIICGTRVFDNYEFFCQSIAYYFKNKPITLIISGACSDKKGVLTYTRPNGTEVFGADGLAEKYAHEKDIPFKPMPADWDKYLKAAGPIRNAEMAKEGEACLAFWDGQSSGTGDMIKKAKAKKIPVRVVRYDVLLNPLSVLRQEPFGISG